MKVVVLLSGGQDSTTTLMAALVAHAGAEIHAVSFDYGQSHKEELEFAHATAVHFGLAKHKVFDITGVLENSSLVDPDMNHADAHPLNKELPASFTPGRNALFLSIAAAYAFGIESTTIYTGVCETDYSGYPDCRREFIDSMQESLSLALGIRLEIITPLMYLDKAETWGLAKSLGDVLGVNGVQYIIDNTLTDYAASDKMNLWGRGTLDNPASALRAAGYYKAVEQGLI